MKIYKNQKVFLSFAFTGEDLQIVIPRMKRLVDMFTAHGVEAYCNEFDNTIKDFKSPGQFVSKAIKDLRHYDVVVAIKASDRNSEGQLMELGAAKALGIPYIICVHESAVQSTYLSDPLLAAHTIVWQAEEDLTESVSNLIE